MIDGGNINQHPYRQLGSAHCKGRTLFCYAQSFLNINSSTARRHAYHNGIPAIDMGASVADCYGRVGLTLGYFPLR